MIYISSSMVYGDFNGLEVDEKTNCKPIGIYGSLKYAGEIIVKSYKQVFDLPYTIIRPSALYGERWEIWVSQSEGEQIQTFLAIEFFV